MRGDLRAPYAREAGEWEDGAPCCRHLKTGSWKGGSKVTGHLARKVGPSYLPRRVWYEGGAYAQ